MGHITTSWPTRAPPPAWHHTGSATMRTGEGSDDGVKFVRPQATYRFTARPDFEHIRWSLRQGRIALGRANHPGGQIGRLHLRIHEPGIVFEAAVVRGLVGEDQERHARIT